MNLAAFEFRNSNLTTRRFGNVEILKKLKENKANPRAPEGNPGTPGVPQTILITILWGLLARNP